MIAFMAGFPYNGRMPKEKEHCAIPDREPYHMHLLHSGAIVVVIFILYYFAQELQILPDFGTSSELTLFSIFLLGLVASTSTCMATSGALFLATIGKQSTNIIPAVLFNLGRIFTYGLFGFLTGFVGKTVSSSVQFGSAVSFMTGIMMVFIGLTMLKLFSFPALFSFSFTKNIFQRLEQKLVVHPKKTAFFLGALTYLLPCGFTQSVQVYALGLADPIKGALVMTIFAIGTMPALLAIGFATSFTKSSWYPVIYRALGVIVLLIGLSYFTNFLSLYGVNVSIFGDREKKNSYASLENGYQEVVMNVNTIGYSPNYFTVKKGVPVKWRVKGENVFGCQGFLVAPKIGVQKVLAEGDNIIEFTPEEKGTIAFSCSMGMFRGTFEVI